VRSIANDDVRDIRSLLVETMQSAGSERPQFGVIAAAGPIDAGNVRLTNRNWTLSQAELETSLGLKRLLIVNDFVAMAHAVPALAPDELVAIGDNRRPPDGNLLVCGPGTGFGVAVLIQTPRGPFAIATEAGHMRLGATTDEEIRVFAKIESGKSLAVEDVLSGRGLMALHRALGGAHATTDQLIAVHNGDGDSAKTLDFFMRVFGRVAGDLALAFDARGGAFLGGGLGRALAPFYARTSFREAFDDHPPYQERMRAIPVFVIGHEAPGLVGALQIARSEFAGTPPLPRSNL
jgi:glucokinase